MTGNAGVAACARHQRHRTWSHRWLFSDPSTLPDRQMSESKYRKGDRIEYIGAPVFDGIIWTGDVGVVVEVTGGWVIASWRDGIHSVPLQNVRPGPPVATHRVVTDAANQKLWGLFPEDVLFDASGRERDPYWQSSCHPDVVALVWDTLGAALSADCRARANGVPVLAHPTSNRIFAAAHGTAYALWLTAADFAEAASQGASSVLQLSGGSRTDLRQLAGKGWIWGREYSQESAWLRRSYRAAANRWQSQQLVEGADG